MKQILKDFIYFTNMENIENLNHNIQEKFSLEKTEIEDQNIEKVQFDNLKFGIYFSKNTENGEKILIFKNKRKIKCGNYFINGAEKGFYTDLYFLVLYQDGKDRNKISWNSYLSRTVDLLLQFHKKFTLSFLSI